MKIGEPVPLDGDRVRLHRTGLVSQALSERGIDVEWFTSTFNHQDKSQRFATTVLAHVNPRYRIHLIHAHGYSRNVSISRAINHWETARKFSYLIRHLQRPDLILCAFPTIGLSLACVRYGLATGVPVVVDVRDLWPDFFVDLLPRGLQGLGRACMSQLVADARFIMRRATALLAVSEGCLEWALRHAGRDCAPEDRVFPLGYPRPTVDAEEVNVAGQRLLRLGVDPRKTIYWFIGMFGRHRDLGTVIHAARRLDCLGLCDAQFVFSGDGPLRDRWSRMASGLQNVVFTGWINRPEIAYMMHVAAVGLLAASSVPESLPNKLFEYMAAGLPVLSSLPGESSELLDRNRCGLTYKPGDADDLVRVLLALHRNPDLREIMGRNALALYEQRYLAAEVYSAMADYLRGLAERSPGSCSDCTPDTATSTASGGDGPV